MKACHPRRKSIDETIIPYAGSKAKIYKNA